MTLGEFFEGWRERYAQQVRLSSFERKMQAVRIGPFMGLYVDQVRAAEVEDGIAAVAKRSPRQAQLALAALKQVLRNAQERGHVVDDAVLRIKPPRVEEREPRFLSWSEVEELAAACTEDRLIVLACLTGLRQGELLALVTRCGLRRQRGPGDPRGSSWRGCTNEDAAKRPSRLPLRASEAGSHLRHTCASLLIAANANPLEIAAQLGHKDARLVFQRYGHLYPGAAERAVQRLDALTASAAVGEAWGGA